MNHEQILHFISYRLSFKKQKRSDFSINTSDNVNHGLKVISTNIIGCNHLLTNTSYKHLEIGIYIRNNTFPDVLPINDNSADLYF